MVNQAWVPMGFTVHANLYAERMLSCGVNRAPNHPSRLVFASLLSQLSLAVKAVHLRRISKRRGPVLAWMTLDSSLCFPQMPLIFTKSPSLCLYDAPRNRFSAWRLLSAHSAEGSPMFCFLWHNLSENWGSLLSTEKTSVPGWGGAQLVFNKWRLTSCC